MSSHDTYAPSRFYRSADRAILGGVCAGLADSFGFNLRVLRLLALIAFFLAMPVTVIAYLAIVFLVPARAGWAPGHAEHEQPRTKPGRKERRAAQKRARRDAEQGSRFAKAEVAQKVRSKCESLEQRLASLEKYITSSRYQLDNEFRRL